MPQPRLFTSSFNSGIKAITIPSEPADPDLLLSVHKPFGAVRPLVADINLSLDNRFLYLSGWGTGVLLRFVLFPMSEA